MWRDRNVDKECHRERSIVYMVKKREGVCLHEHRPGQTSVHHVTPIASIFGECTSLLSLYFFCVGLLNNDQISCLVVIAIRSKTNE